MTLYGFFSRQDLKMFNQLLGVTGIGPKAALGILSSLSPDDLRMAIIAEDSKGHRQSAGNRSEDSQARDPGSERQDQHGRGTAAAVRGWSDGDGGYGSSFRRGWRGKEAIEALVALGYSPTEATKAVRQVTITEDMNSEAVLKASLKFLAF